jgi:hypothetical protein
MRKQTTVSPRRTLVRVMGGFVCVETVQTVRLLESLVQRIQDLCIVIHYICIMWHEACGSVVG